MCELFAMSSDHPIRLVYELRQFAPHGGVQYHNRDGWGIVFAQQRDAYLFKEPAEGVTSALERLIVSDPPLSRMVMAHVRRATAGQPALCNTHPFRRAVNGEVRSFAHNGDLPQLRAAHAGTEALRNCVGETDSELAFMILLERLAALNATDAPADRLEAFAQFCSEMREFGDCNFLYAEGEKLFVHADKRRYEDSNGKISEPREPGLHICEIPTEKLVWRTRGAATEKAHAGSQLLVASVPLGDGQWDDLPRGTVLMIEHGKEIMRM